MSLACCDGTSSIHPCQSNWKLAPELIPAALLSAENLGIYFASSRILAVTGHSLPPHAAALRSLPTVRARRSCPSTDALSHLRRSQGATAIMEHNISRRNPIERDGSDQQRLQPRLLRRLSLHPPPIVSDAIAVTMHGSSSSHRSISHQRKKKKRSRKRRAYITSKLGE
ncbi:unnamed protein product [Fusarium fujikuroi]|nr:unnamed protein product [Fusarium fujikuroi]